MSPMGGDPSTTIPIGQEESASTQQSQQQQPQPAQPIDLDSMSLEQLHQLQQQEESRLQTLTNHYAQLRQAAIKIQSSLRALQHLNQQPSPLSGAGVTGEGRDVMVPLTESVYIPGKMKESNKFLVELGTGYYVEKSLKETTGYLERKLRIVDANSENVTAVMQGTRRNIDAVTASMQGKLLEIRAKQEGQRIRSAAENNG